MYCLSSWFYAAVATASIVVVAVIVFAVVVDVSLLFYDPIFCLEIDMNHITNLPRL